MVQSFVTNIFEFDVFVLWVVTPCGDVRYQM